MVIEVLVRKRPVVVVVYALFDLLDGIRHPIQTTKRIKKSIQNAKSHIFRRHTLSNPNHKSNKEEYSKCQKSHFQKLQSSILQTMF